MTQRVKPGIQRLLELQRFLLDFQAVKRVVHIPPDYRYENDTEHSYNLAMTAWYLGRYFPELNPDKLIRFALVHDLVEVHAGDTFIYGAQAHLDSKQAREATALKQLQGDWHDFPGMLSALEAYESKTSPEALFIYALDKIMPMMVITLTEGYSWKKEGITHTQQHEAKRHKVALSEPINGYYNQLYDLLNQHPEYFAGPSH